MTRVLNTTIEEPGSAVEELTVYQEALDEALDETKQHRAALLRVQADLHNMRKRRVREIEDSRLYANSGLLEALLPMKDNLELALAAASESSDDNLREGIDLVLRDFDKVLKDFGVETIDPEAEPFDPERHEAIALETRPELPGDTVCQVQQRGYVLNGRLVRPARVIVSSSS